MAFEFVLAADLTHFSLQMKFQFPGPGVWVYERQNFREIWRQTLLGVLSQGQEFSIWVKSVVR